MALVYLLLSEADPSKGQDVAPTGSKRKKPKKPKASKPVASKSVTLSPTPAASEDATTTKVPDVQPPIASPALHIDIQIHISSDASADQIEQIFASMAKHLYKKSN